MKNKWKDIIDRWETSPAQKDLNAVVELINNDSLKYSSSAEEFLAIILAFAATIYNNAYCYDNLTRRMYAYYSSHLKHIDYRKPNEYFKQEILKTMPKGFEDCQISSNWQLGFSNHKSLTVKKANQFLDYLQSPRFYDIMTKIVAG